MAEVTGEINKLRNTIVSVVSSIETGTTIPDVCLKLGLPPLEWDQGSSKKEMVLKMVSMANDQTVIQVAKQMLLAYPGSRGKPDDEHKQIIQDAIWWIECSGHQQISNVVRFEIAEKLENFTFWGRSSGLEDFFSSAQIYVKDYLGVFAGNDGHLYQHQSRITDLLDIFNFLPPARNHKKEPNPPPVRVTILSFLKFIGISEWPDKRFILFIERVIHPEVQKPDDQRVIIQQIDPLLEKDGFEFFIDCLQGGSPLYRVKRISIGVQGAPKYIIFAPIGMKPDIVLTDAVNMEIQVVNDVDKFVVYDQPPPSSDLTWDMLVDWWCRKNNLDSCIEDNRRKFGLRLKDSLQSEPERILFNTFFKVFRPKYRASLPALIPQVFLHFDPRPQREREKPVLFRQRIDFLMLLRNATRIIIEIDGAQHYSDSNGRAVPRLYAEMVAEDRRIKLLGYEVYRFGGAEFMSGELATKIVISFFNELFELHNIQQE